MIKVINLVSVLAAPVIIQYNRVTPGMTVVIIIAIAIVVGAVWYSKRTGEKEYLRVEPSVSGKYVAK
jgi:K(+)-stimulated pyrophosphate-energized sodium pump